MSDLASLDAFELCDEYYRLNARRADIDSCIVDLPPADPRREILWEQLETTLERLREVVVLAAETPAAYKTHLPPKAATLANVLRSGDGGSGPVFPKDSITTLTLSLTDDIARLFQWQSG
jgi:hypothetical protein